MPRHAGDRAVCRSADAFEAESDIGGHAPHELDLVAGIGRQRCGTPLRLDAGTREIPDSCGLAVHELTDSAAE